MALVLFVTRSWKPWSTHSCFVSGADQCGWVCSYLQVIPNREETTSLHQWLILKFRSFRQHPDTQDFATISLCSTLWFIIWKQRNRACLELKSPNPMATIIQLNGFIANILNNSIEEEEPVQKNIIRANHQNNIQRRPRLEVIKINTDAGFNSHLNIGSVGIIARDYKGDIDFGITKKFLATSPLIAEAFALREAAAVAVNFQMSKILLETDCLDLVRCCRREIKKR